LDQGLEISKVMGVFSRCGGHEVSVLWNDLDGCVDGVFNPVITLFFQLVG
jgi:hypothetical protein